jgi:arabinose-5-phosphate isomerase
MRKGKEIPTVLTSQSIGDAIREISKKLLGFTVVINKNGQPIGIFTDGDLRRALLENYSLTDCVEDVMTKKPITLLDNQLAIDAINKMEDSKINSFLVLNIKGDLVGVINLHDLLKSKVI